MSTDNGEQPAVSSTEPVERPTTYNKQAQVVAIALVVIVVLGMLIQSYFQMRSREQRKESEAAAESAKVQTQSLNEPPARKDFKEAQEQAARELEALNKAKVAEERRRSAFDKVLGKTDEAATTGRADSEQGRTTLAQVQNDFQLDEARRVLLAGREGFGKTVAKDDMTGLGLTAASTTALPAVGSPQSNATELPRLRQAIAEGKQRADQAREAALRIQDAARQQDPALAAQLQATSGAATGAFGGLVSRARVSNASTSTFGESAPNRAVRDPQNAGPKDGELLMPTGTVASGSLKFDAMSDYSGDWLAELQRPVYDVTGEWILLPTGTKITGKTARVSSVNEVIQNRMGFPVLWAIRPDGKRIDLRRAAGLDAAGVAALSDQVDYHILAQMLGVGAYAVVGLGPSMNTSTTAAVSQRDMATATAADQARVVGQNFAAKFLQIVPTVTIRAGTPIKIFFEDDIYVTPWAQVDSRHFASQ